MAKKKPTQRRRAAVPIKLVRLRPAVLGDLLSVDETCSHYKVGTTKLYELIREGKIVARKLGTRTLIERASLDRFFATLPKMRATR